MKDFVFSTEKMQDMKQSIKNYFLEEWEEELSDFKAEQFLEFIIKNIGPSIYNQALADAHTFISERIEELFGLEKRI
ncbi:MAG: hypothetical protein H6Q75_708 [Firmicutes bacterium]|nr:hypothetical protein [Bacillota bacterium]